MENNVAMCFDCGFYVHNHPHSSCVLSREEAQSKWDKLVEEFRKENNVETCIWYRCTWPRNPGSLYCSYHLNQKEEVDRVLDYFPKMKEEKKEEQ